jgi:acyl-CoA synthetase (AMP-forming)/AMP-acid ligase II
MQQEDTKNIAGHLAAMAARRPDVLAVAVPGRGDHYAQSTFEQLNTQSDLIARGLRAAGLEPGMRTVLMVKPSLEFFTLSFALFKLGAVPVLIDPGMGLSRLGKCLAEAQPEAFIGIPMAHMVRRLLGWARQTLRIVINVGPRRSFGMMTLEQVRRAGANSTVSAEVADPAAEATAAILFTSGSTGAPKGAVYSHANFNAQIKILTDTYAIEPGEIDLCTFPLFALFAPALGMTAIIPRMDFTRPGRVDPDEIFRPIKRFGVTNLFGSPALLACVGRAGAQRNITLPTLRRVISAGAPVSAAVIERFVAMLSKPAQVFTPYGATEALPVCSIGSDEILGQTRHQTDLGRGVCVGRPVGDVALVVIRLTDEPIPIWSDQLLLPTGEVGEIVVKGPVVTASYFNRPQSNALAKIAAPKSTEGFYHRMGDLGYLDAQGRLWMCGRKSQRVITPQGILFTVPCEAVFNTHSSVYRSALVGVGSGAARRAVICIELESEARRADKAQLRHQLLELAQTQRHTRDIAEILFWGSRRARAFPVDIRHNAKINREKLARWAEARLR